MTSIILQLTLAAIFIVLVCFFIYKAVLPLCLKIIDLSVKSPLFRKGTCLLLALVFGFIGTLQLIDFIHNKEHGLSKFFPASYLSSLLFIYLCFARSKTSGQP